MNLYKIKEYQSEPNYVVADSFASAEKMGRIIESIELVKQSIKIQQAEGGE